MEKCDPVTGYRPAADPRGTGALQGNEARDVFDGGQAQHHMIDETGSLVTTHLSTYLFSVASQA